VTKLSEAVIFAGDLLYLYKADDSVFFYNKTQKSYFKRLYGATGWFLYPDNGNRRTRKPKRIAEINPMETGTREG
jgi:uncharacterized membrane protein